MRLSKRLAPNNYHEHGGMISQLLKPKHEVRFQKKYKVYHNRWGEFRLLPNRERQAAFFDPDNWLDFTHLHTDPEHGHQGRRKLDNFQITTRNPATGAVKTFLFKDHDFSTRPVPNEVEAGEEVALARVRGEKPWGYWTDVFGHVYAVFERMEGHTMVMEPRENWRPLLTASVQYGRLFAAGLMHGDTGIKHVFITPKKSRLFDFETVHSEPVDDYRRKDFGNLIGSAVMEKRIASIGQVDACLEALLDGAKARPSERPLEKRRWKNFLAIHLGMLLRGRRVGLDSLSLKNRMRAKREMVLLRRMIGLLQKENGGR